MKETRSAQNKKEYLTLLNVCSAVAVVFLHVNNEAYNRFYDNVAYWATANVIRSFFYFAVPVFFMISGANLLDYNLRYSGRVYAQKRIRKVVVPFLFWSFIGFCYYITFENPDMMLTPVNILNGLLNSQYVGTYWFFIPLFLVYLSVPVLALIPQEKKCKAYTYLVALGFGFNLLIPYLIIVFHIQMDYQISFGMTSGYILYALLGYVIDRSEFGRLPRILIYLAGAAGFFMDLMGTYTATMAGWYIDETFSGYLNVPCFLYSAAVFTFFKYEFSKVMSISVISRAVHGLADYSFGIYLLHRSLLWLGVTMIPSVFAGMGFQINVFSLAFEFFGTTLIILICIPLIWIIRKIPFLRYTMP